MMEKLDLKKVGKLKPNPIFKGLRASLKDPKNFKKIQKQLFLSSEHQHKTVRAYVSCAWCNEQREAKRKLMKQIGFKSYAQYLEWQKIMLIIVNKKSFQL